MKFFAPAKINLTLEVLDRRDDGYHGIRSVMVPLELADELTIEASDTLTFSCDEATLSNDDNLAVRAVRSVAPDARLSLSLRKRIPSQAGLGGGSSDAAAVLLALMQQSEAAARPIDWMKAARALGSDVPFFLAQTGALVEGTGERVTALGALPAWHVLVVKPPAAVSTAAAYAEMDRLPRPSRPRNTSVSLEMLAALQRADFDRVCDLLSNDFEEPISKSTPDVALVLRALRSLGAHALLCGSGSAVFALAQTGEEIDALNQRIALPAAFLRFRTQFARTSAWRP